MERSDDSYRQVRIFAPSTHGRYICFRRYQEILPVSSRNRSSFAPGALTQRVLPPPSSWYSPEPLGILRFIVSLRVAQRCRKRVGLMDERERKARFYR